MDRRDFFKSIFLTPLLTPLLLASKSSNSDAEFYMISDSPHHFLSPLLQELKALRLVSGNSFSFHNPIPQQEPLTSSLVSSGWIPVSNGARAHMTLASSFLHSLALPSFTLAREGKIWDLRTRKLHSIWTEMNHQLRSNRLTVASFHSRPSELIPGKSVSLYQEGRKIQTISLGQNSTRSFGKKDGRITVCVKDGKARVEESSCRHKICVHCPPAVYTGERIICAPNHFMLEVDGPSSVDTIIG